jgi:hypothetical protein
MRLVRFIVKVSLISTVCFSASAADARAFRMGRLSCLSSERVGRLLGSTQSLYCEFYDLRSSQRYRYTGRIRRTGLDIGLTSGGTLSWAVLGRNSHVGPSSMRGNYVGVSGKVAFGPGFGANALIGGSRRMIVLQPLSIERSVGINLAAGITRLTLKPRGTR